MTTEPVRDAQPLPALTELLAHTVARLESEQAPDEALGVYKRSRGIGMLRAAPTLVPAGRAWRLGTLLLDRSLRLFETGEVTRAIEPKLAVNSRTLAAEERREVRRAAARGPFPEGEVVNLHFSHLALDGESLRAGSGPLSLSEDGDVVLVRWNPAGGLRPLEAYLADRVSLLADGV